MDDLIKGDITLERVVIDTETTGIEVKDGERITTLSAVRGQIERGVLETCMWYVDTEGRQSDPGALAVHRVKANNPRQVKEIVMLEGLRRLVGNRIVVFQNGTFDMGFINDACDRVGMPRFDWVREDTLDMGRKRFPGRQANLDALCKHLGYDSPLVRRRKERHDSTDDCRVTFEVWRRLVSPDTLEFGDGQRPRARFDTGSTDPIPTFAMAW